MFNVKEVDKMRIQGPNPYLNIYKQQKHQQINKENNQKEDKLNISQQAKLMQISKSQQTERTQFVQNIKEQVQSGTYEIDSETIADKMIHFWSKEK